MNQEDLQKIIEQFDEDNLKREGIFGIYRYGGGADESYISANKEGLELFAIELLKASKDADAVLSNVKKENIPFNSDEDWIDENSDTIIHYIEPVREKRKTKEKYKATFKDKLVSGGCGLSIVIAVIAAFIGLWTMVKWLF